MKSNKSTAAQRSFIAALAKNLDEDTVRELVNRALAKNGNRPWGTSETLTQATNRMTKTVASGLIDSLKNA